jgi:coenzyme F420-0:L-glutamate ligase / coenzyme F420-1:gamma-L-glutamate ligase
LEESDVVILPLKTDLIRIGDSVLEAILKSLKRRDLSLRSGDVLVITSKVVSYEQNRVVKLGDIAPSEEARKLAEKFVIKPEFAELVLREADVIYGGVPHVVLTVKDGMLTANAGIDNKNSPDGWVALWPQNLGHWVSKCRKDILSATGVNVGVLVTDSSCMPLRKGTIGVAMAISGVKPLRDHRGETDLYGKKIIMTQHAIAQSLASAAHLVMGEATEQIPAALIRGASVEMDESTSVGVDLQIPFEECFFAGALLDYCSSKGTN